MKSPLLLRSPSFTCSRLEIPGRKSDPVRVLRKADAIREGIFSSTPCSCRLTCLSVHSGHTSCILFQPPARAAPGFKPVSRTAGTRRTCTPCNPRGAGEPAGPEPTRQPAVRLRPAAHPCPPVKKRSRRNAGSAPNDLQILCVTRSYRSRSASGSGFCSSPYC